MVKKQYIWGPINAVPLFFSGFNNSFINLNKELNHDFQIAFKNSQVSIILNNDEFINFSIDKYKYLFDNLDELYINWEKKIHSLQAFEEIVNNGLSRFDDEKFVSLFKEWVKIYNEFWGFAILPELANIGGKYLLLNKLSNLENSEEILNILSSSEKLNFKQNQEQEFYSMLFLENENMFNIMINSHANKYYWLNNNFASVSILPIGYFEEELSKISKEQAKNKLDILSNYSTNLKNKKRELITKHNLDQETINLSNNLSYCDWLNNLKKKYSLLITHINSVFAHEIALREDIDYEDLLYFRDFEILDLLTKHELPNSSERKKAFVIINKDGLINHFEGDIAKDKINF